MIVQENIIDYLNRKYHDGILQSKSAYAIMPIGKNDRSAHAAQRKAPDIVAQLSRQKSKIFIMN